MESIGWLRFITALAFVLGLIAATGWVLRRFAERRGLALKPQERDMAVVESLGLDARRRLIRVRAGLCEHIILLGINGETIVESRPWRKTAE